MALSLRGDFWGGSADTSTVLSFQISRDVMNAREIFAGQQTYYVAVAPGVDLALMAAMCICLDEMKNER
ncbi:hypothetical protein L198_05675 [Cryptococcus wingfieldii CBS 7118]|uniref:Tubby C-terminal domain-containing protein n=1 Tax=Cryptococcus wingfieldii CBS 7118 TaxID=1295528 RepID=A0A1E3ITP6_9TREE|nr:hypothetical protein L198_05675 [Cryptococcus wingfieldii CBS 7118]ODN92003.1 hypothetical protein L198_05675 [Cryptococcus wingfieldii CBS 7118]